jgi:uncharacterized protein
MNQAWFRFYEELNDFLPPEKQKKAFPYSFNGTPSVKDAIEAIGIPHVEIELILINGISVDFSCKLHNEDKISVYPVFETLDITPLIRLRERPLRETRFVLDVHLGKLAKYLRLCGFDTFYKRNFSDFEIIELSALEKRIILTRDLGLLKNKKVTRGYWIRSQYLYAQMKEVFKRFDLSSQILPFTRCMECNGLLTSVPKNEIIDILLPETKEFYNNFLQCKDCMRIYWEGSHYERMKKFIDKLIKDVN